MDKKPGEKKEITRTGAARECVCEWGRGAGELDGDNLPRISSG